MEKANQKCSGSAEAENQCKGSRGAALKTIIAHERVPGCKTDRESDCPCSGLDRLEADLGIMGSATNQMFASQVAEDITPAEAVGMIEVDARDGSLVFLDVSTEKEYRNWHLEKAINMDIFSLKFSDKLNKLDKEKTYLVYCKMGARSAAAQKVMIKKGFRKVFNIVGGRDRWRLEGFPYGAGPAGKAKVRNCPVLIILNAVARLKTKLRGLLGSLRPTDEVGNH
ncbi:MAG: rhodanese-like domain-containing protein [Deltaproteobacteria bacterium]|jgi:rhodanese-related sulfurtransferase|nr:rhodanese-like domain-containing protein [Deltaproteobacteria bacterium]